MSLKDFLVRLFILVCLPFAIVWAFITALFFYEDGGHKSW